MSNFENDKRFELYNGDCLDVLKTLPDNSVDSIVTDPPYGLSFMGKKWDYDVPSVEIWAECLRVLRPGGHLLAFAGTRTQHRMAVRIEDAGFEIRDMIAWVYGSGFPKSLDVSKAIDKAAGVAGGYGEKKPNVHSRGNHVLHEGWKRPCQDDPDAVDKSGRKYLPGSEAARQWQGWGTALKPALEPITVARKPLVGTVAANVLEHGTGALNIDGCRVGDFQNTTPSGVDRRNATLAEAGYRPGAYQMGEKIPDTPPGRWPANLIHDGSDEVVAGFPQSQVSGSAKKGTRSDATPEGIFGKLPQGRLHNDTGSAARFFYCAKASKKDRDEGLESFIASKVSIGDERPSGSSWERRAPEKNPNYPRQNTHPTVKPTDLMAYLCRLVTPPGGIVLDPFMGSGSTGKAAMREGFRFIGIERDSAYMEIARSRIRRVEFPDPKGSIEIPEPSPDDITSLFV